MSVRWKPLLILSGLFLAIALMGVVAMSVVLAPRTDPLVLARAERRAKTFKHAEIHYKQALQRDAKDVKALEEMADMYEEWAETNPPDRDRLHLARMACLADAAKYGKQSAAPRRALLKEALEHDDAIEAVRWAKELLPLDPGSTDAHYVLAVEALDRNPPRLEAAREHLSNILAAESPRRIRTDAIEARVALQAGDDPTLDALLERSRTVALADNLDPVDGMALLHLRALDAERTTDPAALADRARALKEDAARIGEGRGLSPSRIARLGRELARVDAALARVGETEEVKALREGIDEVADSTFRGALGSEGETPDLQVCRAYAEHLLGRDEGARCLEVIDRALASPLAQVPALEDSLMELREIGVKAALADPDDPKRFERAEPYIRDLIASKGPRFSALGHLFRGAIALEQSGLTAGSDRGDAPAPADQATLRTKALDDLRVAAEQLPRVPAARALYGVALILSQEPTLGRQHLQAARQLGPLEPRYQIWAAWSMVQAGYPEEAEPIVASLIEAVDGGTLPAELAGTLHLLKGEVYQARRSPKDLALAQAEYEKATENQQDVSPAIQLRRAQLDVMLGKADEALARIDQLQAAGQGSPAAENLAILTLAEQGKADEARNRLDAARKAHPRSGELAALDATYKARDGKAEEAERILAEFLKAEPGHLAVGQLRARLLADPLGRIDQARALLAELSERTGNSAPLVQLALLDLERRDYDAVSATIGQIRAQWKEAAVADLLDAQLALARGDLRAASALFGAALEKDPENKVVQLAKADLDRKTGASAEATRLYEEIAKDGPVKELDSGLTLATAARSALASQALESGNFDVAIERLEGLIRDESAASLARPARWQLVAARAAKGEWPAARKEIAELIKDPAATPDERVQAANYYRLHGEEEAARAQLDWVLKTNPAHPGAVVVRAYMLTTARPTRPAEAAAVLRKAIAADPKSPAVFFVLLAAVENVTPPTAEAPARALAALDRGLAQHPEAIDLIQAKYRVVRMTQGPEAAIALVEGMYRSNRSAPLGRLLADLHREEQDLDKAREVLAGLAKADPQDRQAAASLVQVLGTQAALAAGRGEPDRARALDEELAGLIRDFRARFPDVVAFAQADCELALRRGDATRAHAIAEEVDAQDPGSPAGPLLSARLAAAQGQPREEQAALAEALNRNPRQPQVRLQLGRTSLALGEPDAAIEQADRVLDAEPDRPEALVLKAEALASSKGPSAQRSEDLAAAADLAERAIRRRPSMVDAHHTLAHVRRLQGKRPEAIAALKAGLGAAESDPAGLAMLVQLLAEPAAPGRPPADADLREADRIAGEVAGKDQEGSLCLAASVGFHKAGQLDRALPWAEKAADRLDAPATHLGLGDLLMALAEADPDPAQARKTLERALGEYDRVLKVRPDSVEATNNKAWILHHNLGRHREALDLAQGLLRQVDPRGLPGEFFDTLGAIQEALGEVEAAEQSYAEGLRKAPEQPVLNYHMGRLLSANPDRLGKARDHLEKARAASDRLPASTAAEVAALLEKVAQQ